MKNRICLFAGTTEGRLLANRLSKLRQCELCVCVATEYGETLMDSTEATHPFARVVSGNIKEAAGRLQIPRIRVARGRDDVAGGAVYVSDAKEAARYLAGTQGNILLTTGSKELAEFELLERDRLYVRVLPLASSLEACGRHHIAPGHICAMQGPFSEEMNLALLRAVSAKWMVTKETGKNGGFEEKICAARKAGAGIVVIRRPCETDGVSPEEAYAAVLKLCGAEREERGERIGKAEAGNDREGLGRMANQRQNGRGRKVYIIGTGPGAQSFLTERAVQILSECDCVIGAGRVIESISCPAALKLAAVAPDEILKLLNGMPECMTAAAVMSGDTGFFSGAKRLAARLAEAGYETERICGISSAVYFAAELGTAWEDIRFISLHGREGNLISAVRRNRKVMVLAGGENTAASICGRLCEYGFGHLPVTVGERLSYDTQSIISGTAKELSGREFDPLSLVYIENETYDSRVRHGIPDEEFVRGAVPMTKSEVRSLILSNLDLKEDSVVYDIGAGTGSVSVEMALAAFRGAVYAIERNPEAIELIQENAVRFQADNIRIVSGEAPEAMEFLPVPTHAFIGGTAGRSEEIVSALRKKNPDIRIVMSAVTLETLADTIRQVRETESRRCQISAVSISRAKRTGSYHMMTPQNQVYIIQFCE